MRRLPDFLKKQRGQDSDDEDLSDDDEPAFLPLSMAEQDDQFEPPFLPQNTTECDTSATVTLPPRTANGVAYALRDVTPESPQMRPAVSDSSGGRNSPNLGSSFSDLSGMLHNCTRKLVS